MNTTADIIKHLATLIAKPETAHSRADTLIIRMDTLITLYKEERQNDTITDSI